MILRLDGQQRHSHPPPYFLYIYIFFSLFRQLYKAMSLGGIHKPQLWFGWATFQSDFLLQHRLPQETKKKKNGNLEQILKMLLAMPPFKPPPLGPIWKTGKRYQPDNGDDLPGCWWGRVRTVPEPCFSFAADWLALSAHSHLKAWRDKMDLGTAAHRMAHQMTCHTWTQWQTYIFYLAAKQGMSKISIWSQ